MDDRQRMRASDADRQEVIERLRTALDEGRLKMVVSINLVVSVLVSATTAQLIYPWPLWVAGPWAAVLLAVSVSVTQARRGGDHRNRLRGGAQPPPARAQRPRPRRAYREMRRADTLSHPPSYAYGGFAADNDAKRPGR